MVSEKQYENSSKFDTHLYLNAKFKTNPESCWRWILYQVPQKETKKILGLGCRTGLIWLANRDHIPQNWNTTLSDYSDGMLGETKLNLSRVKYNFFYEVIQAKDIGVEDNCFDIIMANLMLYHVENKKTLSEIKRTLKKDGAFIATTCGSGNMLELNLIFHTSFAMMNKSRERKEIFFLEN